MMGDSEPANSAESVRALERTIDEDLLRQLQEASELLNETPNVDPKSNPTGDSKKSPAQGQGNSRRAVPRTMMLDDE